MAITLLTAGVAFGALSYFSARLVDDPEPLPEVPPALPIPPSRVAPLAPIEEAGPPPPVATKPPKPVAHLGTLTLLTDVPCQVLKGKGSLGTTPLFNVVLPVGTHLLTLVGPDGQHRLLSAPIGLGKNTAYRVKLSDLPTR